MQVGLFRVRGTSAPQAAEGSSPRHQQARLDRARVEGYGPIAGILLLAGTLLSIPGSLLIEPPTETYLLTALVALTGLVSLALPWERISPLWLHVLGVVATLEVGACVAFIDYAYGFYFVVIAALVAHGARNRYETVAHLSLISATLLVPIAWDPENARAIVREALLIVPSVALAAGVVAYLRERLEAKQRMYRTFAEEAFELTWRIRGIPVPEGVAEPEPLGASIRRPPRSRLGAPMFGRLRIPALAASVLLAFPLATTSLAAAGLGLPNVLVEPLESLGVTLPNQPAGDVGGGRLERAPAGDGAEVDAGTADGEAVASGRANGPAVAPDGGAGTAPSVPGFGAGPPVTAPSPDSPGAAPTVPEEGGVSRTPHGQIDLGATLDRTLWQTTATLDRLLSGLPLLKRR